MKKSISSTLIIVALLFACSITVNAQKKFRGIIVSQLSYSGVDPSMIAMMPKVETVMIYDNLSKEVTDYGMAKIEKIINGDTKTITILTDSPDGKKYIKLTDAEAKQMNELQKDVTINYTSDTKTIAGLNCKKAIINYKNEDGAAIADTVFYTEELGGAELNIGGSYDGLKGFPVEYKVKVAEMTISVTVTEIKKGKVKDTDFLIPSDYVEMSAEEKAQILQHSGEDE
jgi:GLPGLI family protein